jgi:ribonuclease HII
VKEYDIGVDEAGRGPAIGPLVVCAFSIKKSERKYLDDLGVQDSKKMSKKRRELVYEKLMAKSEEHEWGIGVETCHPADIDKWMETGTLNSLEVELFANAIKRAGVASSDVNCLSLDACDVNEERFGRNVSEVLGSNWDECKIDSRHKMDSNDVLVGAASIIAKVNRDKEISILSRNEGLDLGSGYPSDQVTKHAIDLLCCGKMPHEMLRWSWANVQRSWIKQNNRPFPNRFPRTSKNSQQTLTDWNQQEW